MTFVTGTLSIQADVASTGTSVQAGMLLERLQQLLARPQVVHDTVFVLRPEAAVLFGLSADQWMQVVIATLPVLLLYWEVRGRRTQQRKPMAQVLLGEVLQNYRQVDYFLDDLTEVWGGSDKGIDKMPDLELHHVAFDTFQQRVDVLPKDLPQKVVTLYALEGRLPALQRAVQQPTEPLPKPYPYPEAEARRIYNTQAEGAFNHALEQHQKLARKVLVRLYEASRSYENLMGILHNPNSMGGSQAISEDELSENWWLEKWPKFLRGIVRPVRRRWRRWQMIRTHRNADYLP